MKYRIRDIENFVETTGCKTIIQAATKLEISQPALSESLKRLESDLGATLFYRSRTGIELTPSGRVFLSKAQSLIRSLKDLEFPTNKETVFAGRTITIGCHVTVAQYTIPKALKHVRTMAPDYRVELKHDLSRNIQAEIQRGTIDVGVVINPAEIPDLVIQKLTTDTMAMWKGKGDVDKETVICNSDLFQTQSILKKWKNKSAKIISSESLELICSLANENLGYAIAPARAVEASGYKLEQAPGLPTFTDEVCLVYRPEFGKTQAEKIIIEGIKKSLGVVKK
ncbi:LysR family transcriptional regulator [Bdellovibrio sp. KM01]|uniref:LysR family transcriptional regulator n=1 Tax=Bdellovibrio sp. KM01 TaxID=2748865 RepID=UPI0015E9988B|nr:LysR family transcriptional regulator [Bdellovibrio sp. KM01]QLY24557.1 LysR family transcriptional regulator [Bdellovibrio sp. KM01]